MEKIKSVSSVVTLVRIPSFLPVIQWPQIGDYDNPFILQTIPCEKKQDKYFNLRDGKEIIKKQGMLEWLNLTGTVFSYPDGKKILLSRRYADKQLLLFDIANHEFRPETMHICATILREEKKFR